MSKSIAYPAAVTNIVRVQRKRQYRHHRHRYLSLFFKEYVRKKSRCVLALHPRRASAIRSQSLPVHNTAKTTHNCTSPSCSLLTTSVLIPHVFRRLLIDGSIADFHKLHVFLLQNHLYTRTREILI